MEHLTPLIQTLVDAQNTTLNAISALYDRVTVLELERDTLVGMVNDLQHRLDRLEWRLRAEREAYQLNAGRYSWAYPTEGEARAVWGLLQLHFHGADRTKWQSFPADMPLSAGPGQRSKSKAIAGAPLPQKQVHPAPKRVAFEVRG